MAGTSTPNYGLYKPDPNDNVNVSTDLNANMDKIDAGLNAVAKSTVVDGVNVPGQMDTSQFETLEKWITIAIPDPGAGINYKLRLSGHVCVDIGNATVVDLTIKDGDGTGGTNLTTPIKIDGSKAYAQEGPIPFTLNQTTTGTLTGPRTVSLVTNKTGGGGGDGLSMVSANTRISAEVIRVA